MGGRTATTKIEVILAAKEAWWQTPPWRPPPKPELFPCDHVHAAAGGALPENLSDPATVPALLSAPLGAPRTAALLAPLALSAGTAAASHRRVAYAWRPLLAPACAPALARCPRGAARC